MTPSFVTSFLFLLCCTPQARYAQAPANPDKHLLLTLVNEYRSHGCDCDRKYYPPVKALTWNDTLEAAALGHSQYMSRTKKLSHTGSQGSTPATRLSKLHYEWQTCGENIAAGSSTEQDVVEGWIKSPAHCRNIMNGGFKEMGIATGGPYWTQVFGAH